jgi:hypothetical protein
MYMFGHYGNAQMKQDISMPNKGEFIGYFIIFQVFSYVHICMYVYKFICMYMAIMVIASFSRYQNRLLVVIFCIQNMKKCD